jgi:hypothetical protein
MMFELKQTKLSPAFRESYRLERLRGLGVRRVSTSGLASPQANSEKNLACFMARFLTNS